VAADENLPGFAAAVAVAGRGFFARVADCREAAGRAARFRAVVRDFAAAPLRGCDRDVERLAGRRRLFFFPLGFFPLARGAVFFTGFAGRPTLFFRETRFATRPLPAGGARASQETQQQPLRRYRGTSRSRTG